jgi:hypothetical protein
MEEIIPSAPNAIVSTAFASVTIEIITSDFEARSLTLVANFIPFSISDFSFPGVLFHPITSCPASSRRGIKT